MRPLVTLLIIVGLVLFGLTGAVVWVSAGWRTGWLSGPPKIAQNMFPVAGSVSPTWSRRLRERFPIGSSEKELVSRLKREGFEVNLPRKVAGFGWARYPCVYTLTVVWRADASGRVRAVQGGLLNACTRMDRLTPERPPRFRPQAPPEPALVPGAQSA
jgi:hypothetical protein